MLAVVAVMFAEGAANAELKKAWSQMPGHAGEKQIFSSQVNADVLLSPERDYYRFTAR